MHIRTLFINKLYKTFKTLAKNPKYVMHHIESCFQFSFTNMIFLFYFRCVVCSC